jgi:hypothetical protein
VDEAQLKRAAQRFVADMEQWFFGSTPLASVRAIIDRSNVARVAKERDARHNPLNP